MKFLYDVEGDVLRILFRDAPIEISQEPHQGFILDFDDHGKVVGLELQAASDYISRTDLASLTQLIASERPKVGSNLS